MLCVTVDSFEQILFEVADVFIEFFYKGTIVSFRCIKGSGAFCKFDIYDTDFANLRQRDTDHVKCGKSLSADANNSERFCVFLCAVFCHNAHNCVCSGRSNVSSVHQRVRLACLRVVEDDGPNCRRKLILRIVAVNAYNLCSRDIKGLSDRRAWWHTLHI